jgi:hypothetical protein
LYLMILKFSCRPSIIHFKAVFYLAFYVKLIHFEHESGR